MAVLLVLCTGCTGVVEPNQQLALLVKQDQSERSLGVISTTRSLERIKRVERLEKQHEIRTAIDFFNAALIFQHGNAPEHFVKANELSKQAYSMDPDLKEAGWLRCASEDRYLLSIGKAQIWSTQFVQISGGERVLQQPYDTQKSSDEVKAFCFSI